MTDRSLFHRRNPDWEVEGRAARRERRLRTLRGGIAFTAALAAVGAVAFAWAIELGIAASLGIRASLALG
jgi:hypothetical protein